MSNSPIRKKITTGELFQILEELEPYLERCVSDDDGAFMSDHEALGALTEHHYNLVKELHAGAEDVQIINALKLIIAAGMFAIASNRVNGRVDVH